MPSLRRDRETAPAAVSWSRETRPRDAMPDFGDRDLPGYIPGTTGRRAQSRRAAERPRERRNGLPDPVFYVYRGGGCDTLTGHLAEWQIREETAG